MLVIRFIPTEHKWSTSKRKKEKNRSRNAQGLTSASYATLIYLELPLKGYDLMEASFILPDHNRAKLIRVLDRVPHQPCERGPLPSMYRIFIIRPPWLWGQVEGAEPKEDLPKHGMTMPNATASSSSVEQQQRRSRKQKRICCEIKFGKRSRTAPARWGSNADPPPKIKN